MTKSLEINVKDRGMCCGVTPPSYRTFDSTSYLQRDASYDGHDIFCRRCQTREF